MKKILVLVLFFLILHVSSYAQLKYGIGMGMGTSIVDYPKGMSHPELLVVPAMILKIEHRISPSFSGCAKLGFTEQGYKDNHAIVEEKNNELRDLTVKQFCSDFSVTAKYSMSSSFFAEFGIYSRYVLESKVTSDNQVLSTEKYGTLNKFDIGPLIAFGSIFDKLFVELSYKYGLCGCYKGVNWFKHNSFLFSIGFYW